MKFKIAVTISIILHLSLFVIVVKMPGSQSKSGTTYYVDLVNMPGGGSGGKGSGTTGQIIENTGSVRNLTKQKQTPKAKLRYPDKENKKKSPRKRKKREKLVSVVKKNTNKIKKDTPLVTTNRRKGTGSGGLRTGIRMGSGGSGSGTGTGNGVGDGIGNGTGIGNFPYAYYIQTFRGKISASWYKALVAPGLRGKLKVVVYFRIMRNGRVSELRLENKSGNESLDLSAIRAVKDASPFPPLPNDFPGRYLGVHFEFEWER